MRLSVVYFIRNVDRSPSTGIVYNWVGFQCIWKKINHLFTNFLQENLNLKSQFEVPILQMSLPINVQKRYRAYIYVFCLKKFQSHQIFLFGTPFLTFHFGKFCSSEHSDSKETFTASEGCVTVRVSWRMQQVEVWPCKSRILSCFLWYLLGSRFWKRCWQWSRNDVERKRTSQTRFCLPYCLHTLSYDLYRLGWVQYSSRHKNTIAALLSLSLEAKSWRYFNHLTVERDYQTISKLQFRPLLKISSHSNHMDLREASFEKIPIETVDINPFVLMFSKISNTHL